MDCVVVVSRPNWRLARLTRDNQQRGWLVIGRPRAARCTVTAIPVTQAQLARSAALASQYSERPELKKDMRAHVALNTLNVKDTNVGKWYDTGGQQPIMCGSCVNIHREAYLQYQRW